eukprot:TRINITY_DN34654_c0_g1_i1.p1 TRINITY_DN34654_c0_g1~~TRINITY_DN34654_c0_g1_i1.p1  ORF type:complete len:189 (-),score=44.95 TRINITY_DN34654_c0_g1_i1:98-619(-)
MRLSGVLAPVPLLMSSALAGVYHDKQKYRIFKYADNDSACSGPSSVYESIEYCCDLGKMGDEASQLKQIQTNYDRDGKVAGELKFVAELDKCESCDTHNCNQDAEGAVVKTNGKECVEVKNSTDHTIFHVKVEKMGDDKELCKKGTVFSLAAQAAAGPLSLLLALHTWRWVFS